MVETLHNVLSASSPRPPRAESRIVAIDCHKVELFLEVSEKPGLYPNAKMILKFNKN